MDKLSSRPNDCIIESAVEKLEAMGLSYVDIFLSEKESDDEPDLFWLHMEEK